MWKSTTHTGSPNHPTVVLGAWVNTLFDPIQADRESAQLRMGGLAASRDRTAKITRNISEDLENIILRDSLTEDWVLLAIAEDWIRFSLLRHIVKRKNKKKYLMQGAFHLPGTYLLKRRVFF